MTTPVTFRFGEGQISSCLCLLFGCLSLGGVLCFWFPELLTTPEFRAHYPIETMRMLLHGTLTLTFLFGLIAICICRWAVVFGAGLLAGAIALILGGSTAGGDHAIHTALFPLGLDWLLLDLLATAFFFIALEQSFALRREQLILRHEWGLDLGYFVMTHLLVTAILLVTTTTVSGLFSWSINRELQAHVAALPLWVQLPVILLLADLAQYWSHRLMHTIPALWRVHAIHHSAPTMDWLASSRLHLGEILITRTCVLAPIFILGFSQTAVAIYVVYIGVHAIFVHSNVRFTFGWFCHLIVTPAHHHWHHSEDPAAANTNFAVHYPWLDRLFGTWYAPAGQWPTSYGIGNEKLPAGMFRQFLYPLYRR